MEEGCGVVGNERNERKHLVDSECIDEREQHTPFRADFHEFER